MQTGKIEKQKKKLTNQKLLVKDKKHKTYTNTTINKSSFLVKSKTTSLKFDHKQKLKITITKFLKFC